MNKFVKYGLIGATTACFVVGGGIAYLVATFNPNDYKQQIIQFVKENKQRDLHLDGDIKLSFYPNIGADLGKVSLSEHNNSEIFASVENARVSLALMPLLNKQVVVNEVVVSGAKAKLVKNKDGVLNIDDLLSKKESEPSPPVQFDIAKVNITQTNLDYVDEQTDGHYQISDLSLLTGRVAENAPSKIELSAQLKANKPNLDIVSKLATELTFNLEQKQFKFADLSGTVDGTAAGVAGLKLLLSGQAEANLLKKTFDLAEIKLDVAGQKGKDQFDIKLDAPKLALTEQNFTADELKLNANLTGSVGQVVAALALPKVSGNPESVKSPSFKLDVDVKQAAQAFKAKITSPLAINIPKQQVNLSNLVVDLNATGDQLPNKSISSQMKGSVYLDALQQLLTVNLAGGLLQSQVKAQVGVNNFAAPHIKFDVDVDQFDADLYLPRTSAAAPAAQPAPEKSIDLSALRKLNLDGKAHIGALKAANIKTKNLNVSVSAQGGVLNLNPMSVDLYDGRMAGSVRVNAAGVPEIAINQTLSGINVAPFTKDAANFDKLDGRGTVVLNVHTRGARPSEFKQALNGTMSMNLADGAIKGINIAKTIRDAKAMIGKGPQTTAADDTQKTDFSELRASFNINNGVAHNDDLYMKSPLIRLGGEGDIDIANSKMNYLAKATVVGSLEGQGGRDDLTGLTVPVRAQGPFTALKYTIDFKEMFKAAAKQKVEEKKQEVIEKVQNKVKDMFKGLFN